MKSRTLWQVLCALVGLGVTVAVTSGWTQYGCDICDSEEFTCAYVRDHPNEFIETWVAYCGGAPALETHDYHKFMQIGCEEGQFMCYIDYPDYHTKWDRNTCMDDHNFCGNRFASVQEEAVRAAREQNASRLAELALGNPWVTVGQHTFDIESTCGEEYHMPLDSRMMSSLRHEMLAAAIARQTEGVVH